MALKIAVVCIAVILSWADRLNAQASAMPDSDERIVRIVRDSAPTLMRRFAIPGAAVAVVRGDQTLLLEGFGVADVARGVAVTPATSFRIASVAKVFVSMAAMRLASEGRLTMEADVGRWVPDVPVGGTGQEPLTMRQLLTHTAGLDDYLLGYFNPVGAAPPPLEDVLRRKMPPRTRPPGDTPGYSNYGYALAGLVVERIVGVPFHRYVEDSMLAPIGLSATRFLLRPALDSVHALEYTYEGEVREQRSTVAYPAGNIATTAADMARLLHLCVMSQGEPIGGVSLFDPVASYHPEMPPLSYAFAATDVSGQRVWMKGGAGPSHSAMLALIPELGLGVFIAANRQDLTMASRLIPMIVNAASDSRPVAAIPPAPAVRLDGDFLWSRASLTSFEKVLGLAAQTRIRMRGADTVVATGEMLSGTFIRIGATVFRRRDGEAVAFRADDTGRSTHLFHLTAGQPIAFQRIPLHRSAGFQLVVLLGSMALSTVAAVAAARAGSCGPTSPAWARAATVALPVAQLATAGTAFVLARSAAQLWEGPSPALYSTLAMTTVTAVAAIAHAVGSSVLATTATGPVTRGLFIGGAAAGIGLAWFLASNNLVGFQF